jgi:hypothetical protein
VPTSSSINKTRMPARFLAASVTPQRRPRSPFQ